MSFKKIVAAFAIVGACAAQASTVTTDFTDLWYNPAEDGWGVNLVQQEEVIFATLYVYDGTRTPMWYVASDVRYQGRTNGALVFSGTLYETTGSPFAATWNPSLKTVRSVGTFTFNAPQVNSGTITYSVDGTTVSKTVQRQTWRNQSYVGQYRGATIGGYSGCSNGNGPYESPAIFTITQVGTQITIHEAGSGYTCTYSGQQVQGGKQGTISGGGTCSDGIAQTFVASEVKADLNAFAGRLQATIGTSCVFDGRMGGVRRNTQ
jgi:hypothetical protein